MQSLSDPGIETLSEVLDPVACAVHLRGAVQAFWGAATVEAVRVRILKHHAGRRCTLEMGLLTDGIRRLLVGKAYSADRFDIFQAMKGIGQSGFGPRDEFSIPQPIAYLPALRLLVLEKVEGPIAKEVFRTGDGRSRAVAAQRCALWLARFQALAPQAGPHFDPHRYMNSLGERTRGINELGGRCAEKGASLLALLEKEGAALRPAEMCAGHGSYSPAQIILAGGRTVTFDWDGYDVADPARDVGRFLAAMRRLALGRLGSVRALDGPAEVFLRTYRAASVHGGERNLRFFLADACLTLAAHDLARPGARWEEKAAAMLDEGLRVLAGEHEQ